MKVTEKKIDFYLKSPFNVEIYKTLTKGVRKGLFPPIEFFQLIHREVRYFRRNSDKYLLIERHYSKIKLQGEQLFYFLWILCAILTSIDLHAGKFNNIQIKSLDLLKSELQKIDEALHGIQESTFDFWRVQKHIESLPSTTERVEYIIEMIAFCKQTGHEKVYPEFIRNCELEIDKLNAISQLNKDVQIPEQRATADISPKPIQATDFHKIMTRNAALKFAEIEQQLIDRGYINEWKEGKGKQKLCGLIYHLDSKSFFGNLRANRAKLNAARRFFEQRYNNIDLKQIFRKAQDPIHQVEFRGFINL